MTAIPEYKINFEATVGWEYTVSPEKALMNAGVDAADAQGMASRRSTVPLKRRKERRELIKWLTN